MKALFLVFHGFAAYNGISKKISYQVDALRKCGIETQLCYLTIDKDGTQKRMLDDTVLENYGAGIKAKIAKRICYNKLTDYIIQNNIDLLYIRSAHNANPFINKMVRKVHNKGVKIVMEIPTYPYEGEFANSPFKNKLRLKLDILCRTTMMKYLDHIVSFTDLPTILGVHNISISNGIDFNCTPVKTTINDTSKQLNLIGVAELHYWHAFDRLINGLAEYYSKPNDLKIIFNIVGEGAPSEVSKLKEMTKNLNLGEYVLFHGTKSGVELDDIFNKSDIGIASLGRHRSKITKIKTLKNREYAARGIPFIYSEIDDDFENMPYIIKAPADETAIDIQALVKFYQKNKLTPTEIRNSIITTLSWQTQMQKVINQTFKQ